MINFSKTYPTDLKYSEWLLIAKFFPSYRRGRPCKWARWQIVNAILYVTRTGCQWRMLPKGLPPWQTVYGYFRRWTRSGVSFAECGAEVIGCVPTRAQNQPGASGVSLRKALRPPKNGEQRGVDVYKQTAGRKRHIVVDTLGLLLIVVVHSASLQDGSGGKLVLQKLFELIKHSVHNRYNRLLWVLRLARGIMSLSQAPKARKLGDWQLETAATARA